MSAQASPAASPQAPHWLQAALRGLTRLEKAVCIAGFIGITGALFLDLAGRELMGRGIFGAQRFAAYCMVVVAFVGFALAVEWRAHLGIEVADKLTPAAWNPQMERLADFTSAAGCIFLAYWSWRFVLGSFRDQAMGQGLVILLWPVQTVLIWCFVSSALRHLSYAVWPSLRPPAAAGPESVEAA